VTYRRKKDAVDYVFQLIVYAILLAGAAWMWTFARDDFAVLFGKHVSDMSAWGMLSCLVFARLVFRCVVHAGADETDTK